MLQLLLFELDKQDFILQIRWQVLYTCLFSQSFASVLDNYHLSTQSFDEAKRPAVVNVIYVCLLIVLLWLIIRTDYSIVQSWINSVPLVVTSVDQIDWITVLFPNEKVSKLFLNELYDYTQNKLDFRIIWITKKVKSFFLVEGQKSLSFLCHLQRCM